ncbi:MAG: ADP-ribosylglycohydrolase family protein [Candidatus Cryptobacteroides sp.]
MFGAICGDTIGSTYEFDNTKDYGFELFPKGSCYTDDSVMTLAVAKWLLIDAEYTQGVLENCMVELAEEYPCPVGGYGGMFREWLFRPRALNGRNGTPVDGKRHPYGSWGNGSAMRASACGWFFNTLEETERVAGISASITHNHPEGIKGAQATAAAIYLARIGKKKDKIKEYISSRYGYDLERSYEFLNRTYEWDSSCQGTVPEAIIAFLESDDFEDAIRKAVSMGGDSDTLACITGGIAEAYYKGIPNHIAASVWCLLPEGLREIVLAVSEKTSYGRVFSI